MDAAAYGGKIGIIGAFWGEVAVAYRAANRKEIDLRWCNSYATWNGVREYQIALDLVADGGVVRVGIGDDAIWVDPAEAARIRSVIAVAMPQLEAVGY